MLTEEHAFFFTFNPPAQRLLAIRRKIIFLHMNGKFKNINKVGLLKVLFAYLQRSQPIIGEVR
jgi:hypothetical protein